jgi:hypothetical protein
MNTPARFCLRLGTLLLSLMVTLLWAEPRAQSSAARTYDVSDPTVELAFGVLQTERPESGDSRTAPQQPREHQPAFDVSVVPAVSDLVMPDQIVPVVAPAQNGVTESICEDV